MVANHTDISELVLISSNIGNSIARHKELGKLAAKMHSL